MMGYKSKKDLADEYGISVRTITNCYNEMRELGEYGDFSIILLGKRLIKTEAFEHFIKNRASIRNGRPYTRFGEVK